MIHRSLLLAPLLALWLPAAAAVGSDGEVILSYPLTRGRAAAEHGASGAVLHANAVSTGPGKLVGISPAQGQGFFLLRAEEGAIPATREEAAGSEHSVSFAVNPVAGKVVTLRKLAFSVGAASVRLEGRLHGFVKVQYGGQEVELPVAFSREGDESGDAYPIRRGDQRDVLAGRGVVDLTSLPAPLDSPVTFRLFLYLTEADLESIPAGTNYSVRFDDIALIGSVQ